MFKPNVSPSPDIMESRNEFFLKEKNGVSLWLYVTATRICKVEFYLSKIAMGTQNGSNN